MQQFFKQAVDVADSSKPVVCVFMYSIDPS